ncbi:MAG: hypothetical protein RL701_4302 [Pseudomonadota bacterium]
MNMRNIMLLCTWLAACDAAPDPHPTAPLRPVLTTVVRSEASALSEFVGRVEPRYATQLGFRVGGRIVRRFVTVGDRVQQGAEIAALDGEALALALQAAEAQSGAVRAKFENARTSRERQAKLVDTHAIAQAQLDSAQATLDAATAALAEADARLAKAKEDATYATLRAEFAGVITKIDAEAGQAVAPNTVIAELARLDALDAVVDVPDAVARTVAVGTPFVAALASNRAVTARGKLRQVGPIADSATRTRRLWIALEAPPSELRLGTMVLTTLERPLGTHLQIPSQAIVDRDGATSVWVIDGDHVAARAVTLGERAEGLASVELGLKVGERVVVAGVHSLEDGQRIQLSDEAQR